MSEAERVPPTLEERGLTATEAARRLAADGPNVLSDTHDKSLVALVVELVTEPMIVLLLIAVGLYLLLGEVREAVAMSASVVLILALTLVTEWRTERAARALRDLGSPRALVERDGERVRIPGTEVVVGDLVHVDEGDRVPADGSLLPATEGELLRIDESLLTGESAPATKGGQGPDERALFAGTLVAFGRARMRVTATGARTRMGALGAKMSELRPEPSPLRRDIDRLVRIFAGLGLVVSVALVLWLVARGAGLTEALLSGIGLAIGMIPEEYPVILTVFLALGAWRMAKEHVLVRRLPAIEALGATTVLCVDKTGTLTENRMRVTAVWTEAGRAEVNGSDDAVRRLLEAAALASRRTTSEPMDRAIVEVAEQIGVAPRGTPALDYPFGRLEHGEIDDPDRARALSRSAGRAWRDGEGWRLGLKGAVEAIATVTEPTSWLDPGARALAASGLRVLAVATATIDGAAPPAARSAVPWRLVGLLGIEDPIRAEVPDAVRACARAGVRILMITGDHPDTARAIADRAGIPHAELVTGADVGGWTDAELSRRIGTVNVVARAHPEHKLRIVEALSARGDVVAMTGDGVNDALALKAAAIGIAMGQRGTDVAREAASIVLTDDRFGSIVTGLRRGRRIFSNLERASGFVLMVHVLLAGLALVPVALGLPPALLPLHVVLFELIVDPSCSIVFEREPEPDGLLEQPPRDPKASVLNRRTIALAMGTGVVALAACIGLYVMELDAGASAEAARATAFLGIVAALVAAIPASRPGRRVLDGRSLRALGVLVIAIGGALITLHSVAPLRDALHWAAPRPLGLAAAAGVSVLVVIAHRIGLALTSDRR